MASTDLKNELECSICTNIYTDPVTLRCGHNFCRVCVDGALDTEGGSGVYTCPECRATFQKWPPLQRNITLYNIVKSFLSTQPHQEITGICCTYCIHSPVPAVRSCLHCEASVCDNHLRIHSKGPEHVLTDPSTSLETRRCSVHKKILEYYCTEDNACICVSCSLVGEHRGHRSEILDEASKKKKKKLRNVLHKLSTKRKETEERVQSLEERRRKAQEKAAGDAERVTALFIDIRRRLDNLEKKVLSEISRQEKKVSLCDVIQKLEMKTVELSRKMRHIEELCNMTDPLTVLQDPDTSDLRDPEEEGGDEDTGGHDGDDEDIDGYDEGDEDSWRHGGGDEAKGGHDGDDEDIDGYDEGDEDSWRHGGGDEDTRGHDGGDEDLEGHDKTHDVDVDVITEMLHVGFSDIIAYLQNISPAKPKEMRWQSPRAQSLPCLTQDLPLSGIKLGGDDVIVRSGGKVMDAGIYLLHHMQDLSFSGRKHGGDDVIVRTVGAGGKVKATGKVEIYEEGAADILLDVNTAGNNLLISDDLKTATWTEITQNRPETAERFQYYQVMSGRRFTSGQHYWDVEISRLCWFRVGMCYPSIDKRGDQSYIGYNNKSWCLYGGRLYNNRYSVIHDSKVIPLPHKISSDGVRICLDYEAGQLSFYELCDPIRHLHTFTAAFTEPLHVALCVWRGSIKISRRNSHEERSL